VIKIVIAKKLRAGRGPIKILISANDTQESIRWYGSGDLN